MSCLAAAAGAELLAVIELPGTAFDRVTCTGPGSLYSRAIASMAR